MTPRATAVLLKLPLTWTHALVGIILLTIIKELDKTFRLSLNKTVNPILDSYLLLVARWPEMDLMEVQQKRQRGLLMDLTDRKETIMALKIPSCA